MKRYVISIALVAAVLVSCQRQSGDTNNEGSPRSKGKRQDLYIQISALGSLSYFIDHKLGMKLAGEMFDVKTEYKGPSDYDMKAMTQSLNLAIARRPAGLVVVGFSESLTPAINKAVDAGIPVVTVDADLPRSKRIAFVGTGNFAAGKLGGEKMAELLGGKGKIAIVSKIGQSNLIERVAGYRAVLEKYPDIEIIGVENDEGDSRKAAQIVSLLLQRHDDLAGIACVEAAGGTGTATSVIEAGKAGKVKIVAMDRAEAVLRHIGDGVVDATIVQQTALMPLYAVAILYQLNHVDVPISSDDVAACVPGVPPVIDTGVIVVDKSNYQHFLRERE